MIINKVYRTWKKAVMA